MTYWLIALLCVSNIALVFYVLRAVKLAKSLKDIRTRFRAYKKKSNRVAKKRHARPRYHPDMLAQLAASPLSGLANYAKVRLPLQKGVPNHLPALDCDFSVLKHEIVTKQAYDSDAPRNDMTNHTLRMRGWFHGETELTYLNTLCIAYLRRRTERTEHARVLFHRLWREEGEYLAEHLSTRWLLSSLMTFMDHGETEIQRMIGAVGIAFGNAVKVYEWEHTVREHEGADTGLGNDLEQRFEGIAGIGGFAAANADIFRNMLASHVDLALRDAVAGRVLMTFLIRLHGANTIFKRLDEAKLSTEVNAVQEQERKRHWSFGRHPRSGSGD